MRDRYAGLDLIARYITPGGTRDEVWLGIWATLFNFISDTWDIIQEDRAQLIEELSRSELCEVIRLQDTKESWAKYYELTAPNSLLLASYRIFGFREAFVLGADLLRGVVSVLARATPEFSPPGREMSQGRFARAYPALIAWEAQLRSMLSFGQSMSELLRLAGKERDDDALCKAVRIDRAVIGSTTVSRRVAVAVSLGDDKFLARFLNAAENPVYGERQNARLDVALTILAAARQIGALTERNAAELFIERTRLYPAHGRKDPERSLWRHIQRWKAERDIS